MTMKFIFNMDVFDSCCVSHELPVALAAGYIYNNIRIFVEISDLFILFLMLRFSKIQYLQISGV